MIRTEGRSRRAASHALLAGALLTGLIQTQVSAQVSAQPTTAPADDAQRPTAWHVVREGENLYEITTLYLGSPARWRENARLNPTIENPDRIEPGQRLRVLVRPRLPPRTALLVRLAHRVESLLNPLPWQPSQLREVLRAADAVRTFENASAELRFSDRSELTVTEESLVFLRVRGAQVERRTPSQIEIQIGQADYSARQAAGNDAADDIEIVLGAATVAPKPDAAGSVRTRARVNQTRNAQLMVYDGSSALETATGAVELAAGTGSSVSAEGVASPPERLLPAPQLEAPVAGGSLPARQADFRWQAVDGARSYVVEICRDPGCAQLVDRSTGIRTTTWQINDLPEGRYAWRATAVSASGLDGYPSATQAFEASPQAPDHEPPYAHVRFVGPQVSIPERFLIGPGTTIAVQTGDRGEAGVASWTPSLDGRAVRLQALAGPWPPGDHRLGVEVVDHAGNRFEHEVIDFTFDPVPPVLRWGTSPDNVRGKVQGTDTAPADVVGARPTGRALRFEWTPGPQRSWRKLVGLQGVPKEAPQVGVRPARGSFRLGGSDLVISRKQPLWLAAEDPLCRAVHLSVLVLAGPHGAPRLVVSAVDLLGNITRAIWPLEAISGSKARRGAR